MRKKLFTFLLALVTSVGLLNAAVDDSGSCGDNVTYSFNGTTGAMTITGTGPMTDYASISNVPWNSYRDDITSVTITDGVTTVGSNSFGLHDNLVTVTIGNDVETIGYYAFGDCAKFTTLNLGNSVRHIGGRAFMWAKVLTGFTLPSTLETIGERAFLQNKVITSLTIPSNVTSIGEAAFFYCAALTSITVEATTPPSLGATVFDYVPTSIPLNVPNGSVAAYTAADQWKEFNIQGYDPAPVGPTNVCGDGLTWELNGGVLTISYDGEGTGEMYDFGYEYDENPVNVAPWKENKSAITTVIVGDGVKSIGNYAFNDLGENFTAVTIANSVERIGLKAFMNAKWITEITLPSSLKTIDRECFAANFGFTSITIPSGVTSIGYHAFGYCTGLTSLTCEATTPPTLASGVFYKISNTSSIPLYVPSASVTAYEAAAQWNAFDIQGYDPAPTSASSVTAARFVYNYDCQRSPAYPKKETACTLSGFKDPLEGYKGTRNGNIALGPWKLEFVAYYTPSNNYGCASQVNTAVYQYYSNLSSQEREAKKLEMPIFRLWQYNLTEREFQPAAYGVVCAYAGEANAQDHAALFISSNSYGCFLSGHQHTTSFALTCENDLTTGLAALVDAASASDPYYDVVWPVIVSIDAIGPVELSEHCKYYIEGSRAAYNALTDEQKAQVTNYSTLTNAETQWAALAAVAQPYADAVIDLINAIPNPVVYTQQCKDAIDAAQDAYDALTDGQKVLVTNAETLKNAPSDFINAAHPNILFTADNSNIKRIEDVTLPKSFTAGYFSTDNEFLGILKELYGINEDAYINFIYSNNDAVTRSGNNLTVNPFSGTATVSGNIVIMSTSNDSPYSVNITLELPPLGPTPTPATENSITINGTPQVGDNSISLTYYFDPANVPGICCNAPTLKVKCAADDKWDEIWLSLSEISSGTTTITLDELGSFQAGKTYQICFAYNNGDWVDDVFQTLDFNPTPTNEQVPTNADPENPSYHYSTFFHSTQNYKLSNDGTQAFIADLSNNELVLTEIAHGEQVIPANTAVILRKTGSADPVVLVPTAENGASINSDDNDLRGVDDATTLESLSINPLQCYVLSGKSHDETETGVGFYRIYGNTLKAHKAYVIFAGGQNNAPKKMRFVYGQATSIEDVQGNNVQSTKVIENGVLYIIRDGKTYNAMGQMVK